jgi:hypothetical protein
MQAKTTDENVLKTSVGEHIGCDYFFPVCAKTYTTYSVSRLESERGTLRSDALLEPGAYTLSDPRMFPEDYARAPDWRECKSSKRQPIGSSGPQRDAGSQLLSEAAYFSEAARPKPATNYRRLCERRVRKTMMVAEQLVVRGVSNRPSKDLGARSLQ